jgi:adenylate cyclase
MPVEIERKFLVSGDAWREQVSRTLRLRQAYLAGSERCSVRVRIGEAAAWLGLKGRIRGASRLEFEYGIPLADADLIFEELSSGDRIDKLRHIVPWQGHEWEVDEFLDANRGLVLAEIELGSEDEPFSRPPWLGQEVTLDVRYYNSQLARNPWPQWVNPVRQGVSA